MHNPTPSEAARGSTISEHFRRASRTIANAMGTPWATACAMASILIWALCGPFFNYSSDWQLVINTATTIVTFLMVFFIQNTQNRDSRELHLKLNELIRSLGAARNELIECDDLSDEELDALEADLHKLAERYGRQFTHLHAHVSKTAKQRATVGSRRGSKNHTPPVRNL